MADSYYQLVTRPRIYTSYPLWQYASGGLDYYTSNVATDEDLIRLIQLDPSNTTLLDTSSTTDVNLNWKINPDSDDSSMLTNNLWNFNYMMVLGHNLASTNSKIYPKILDRGWSGSRAIDRSNLVNYQPWGVQEYDGWSLMELNDTRPVINDDDSIFRCTFQTTEIYENPLQVGSILWGKYFDFPQNADLSESLSFDYGTSKKQTISGKTISTANWTKPTNWITEPFGLSDRYVDRGDNFARRTGRRTWNISFDSLAPDNVMNQNPMLNSNGWKAQDNHSTSADGIESIYNISNSEDLFTNVVHRTLGGHLPMVLQLDKDVFTPESFAIVRLDSDFSITQKNPNLYNIKMKLVEQI